MISNYDAYGGGAERWTDQHARMLLERGHEVHLVARHFRGAPDGAVCQVVDAGKTAHRRRLRFARQAEVLLRGMDLDVIHDMGDGWHADLLMPHHGTRRGIFLHNTRHLSPTAQRARRLAYKYFPRYHEFEALERRQYDLAVPRLYLAVSRMIRDHMRLYNHVPEDRIRVVYNGVNAERFRPAADDEMRRRVRRDLGVEDEVLFLIVAHNFKLKGLDTLLRAAARLIRQDRQLKVIVVGDGPVSRYQHLARSLNCGSVVRFVGDQPDPLPYYQAADVFTLPTYYDPCSLVVLEAMATGLPIITSTLNGVHELIRPGYEGRIIEDPSDDAELAANMDVFLDPDARRQSGEAARVVAERHSTDHMFQQHLAIYEELLAKKR